MRLIALTIAAALLPATAMAQTVIYGPRGEYQGSIVNPPRGSGNAADLYGPTGGYQGTIVNPPRR
jgi:hypothetical protein